MALTSAGRDLVEETLPDHLATEHAVTGVLSKAEQSQLAALLQKLTDAALQPSHAPRDGGAVPEQTGPDPARGRRHPLDP